jgi:hypothetical protein
LEGISNLLLVAVDGSSVNMLVSAVQCFKDGIPNFARLGLPSPETDLVKITIVRAQPHPYVHQQRAEKAHGRDFFAGIFGLRKRERNVHCGGCSHDCRAEVTARQLSNHSYGAGRACKPPASCYIEWWLTGKLKQYLIAGRVRGWRLKAPLFYADQCDIILFMGRVLSQKSQSQKRHKASLPTP